MPRHTARRKLAGILAASLLAGSLAACGLEPDPPPVVPTEDYSGTGDLMAKCMQFASQSHCEQEIWGGGER